MSKKKIGLKNKVIDVNQFAEFGAAVMRSLPRDIDPTTAQGWIDNQRALTTVLKIALMPPKEQNETKLFKASEKFRVGTVDGVRISYIEGNFEKWIEGVVEDISGGIQVPVFYQDIIKNYWDKEILKNLGGQKKAVVSLAGIYELMKLQKNGEAGILLNNGNGNIFYIVLGGLLRAVRVSWFDGGWNVHAGSLGDLSRWGAGRRVFSCNS